MSNISTQPAVQPSHEDSHEEGHTSLPLPPETPLAAESVHSQPTMSDTTKLTVTDTSPPDGENESIPPPSAPPPPPVEPLLEQEPATVPWDEMNAIDVPVATALHDPTETSAAAAVRAVPVEGYHLAPTSVPLAGEAKSECHRYEIIQGLWAQLSDDAVITCHENEYRQETELVVRAKSATLGDCFFVGENVSLRAKVQKCSNNASNKWDIVVTDLIVSIENLALDPLTDRSQAAKFLDEFGCGNPEPDAQSAAELKRRLPPRRLNPEEFEEFLRNARDDVRPARDGVRSHNTGGMKEQNQGSSIAVDQTASRQRVDFKIPNARVRAMKCKVGDSSVDFPGCLGSADCTLRVLLEYYCQAIMNAMDVRSGKKAELNAKTATADITSVGGSIVGAAAGAAVLGPVGFVAGSFLGSHFGRKHSGSIAGAAAGAALFGPVGLMAGACIGESTRQLDSDSEGKPKPVVIDSSGSFAKRVTRAASEHISSNKYEYAGSAGVIAGATAGSALGPVGFVAGAYLGSMSARKVVETTSDSMSSKDDAGNSANEKKPYKFGDITRGIIARGKQARAAEAEDAYKFGDFTRGLLKGGER